MKKNIAVALVLMCCIHMLQAQSDKLLNILHKEVNREMDGFKQSKTPPYYISYRVEHQKALYINCSFGYVKSVNEQNNRQLTTMVRVGSPKLDNYHQLRGGAQSNRRRTMELLPIEDDETSIQQILWKSTNSEYLKGISLLSKIKGNLAINVEEEDKSEDFIITKPTEYYEAPVSFTDLGVDKEALIAMAKEYSDQFSKNPELTYGNVSVSVRNTRKYFVASDGSKIAENVPTIRMSLSAGIKADDGMNLPLYESYFGYHMNDLPSKEKVVNDIKNLMATLIAMKDAPVVDPYSGPALLSGNACGVYFHEIFGHRVEGARLKKESDAQTFKKKVGELVLPKDFSVVFDPTIKEYAGFKLNGYYKYDDQGILGKKADVVKNGVLNDFLMCKTPIDKFNYSNGHGRAQAGYQPVSRQSNLIVNSTNLLSEEKLRKLFVKELKKQKLEFGYLFNKVSGGFTNNGRYRPNAFNVTPLEIYKVFADGRPDQLVRGVNLVGTPLAMFAEISALGGEYGVFNGTCGAESGGVPVSSITPMLMVNKVEIQRKGKSSEKPSILERPASTINKQ